MRIGYLKTEFEGTGFTTAERSAEEENAKNGARCTKKQSTRLEKAGVKLTPIELPKFSTAALRIILIAEAATAFDDITRDGARQSAVRSGRRVIGRTHFAVRVSFRPSSTCERNARARCCCTKWTN